MSETRRPLAVPSGRLNRLARLGGLGAGVAGRMAMGSVAALGRGERPDARALLLTPANLARVTEQLAQMRGAAMKIGSWCRWTPVTSSRPSCPRSWRGCAMERM